MTSKRPRGALWYAAEGKCKRCGEPLGDDWHADHMVPWKATRRTNVFEMQALCAKCNLKKGSSMSWEDLLLPSPEFQPRDGQVKLFEWASAITLGGECTRASAELVTGYGKTFIAYGVFEILRSRGAVDKMLVFTPGDEQRRQFADDEAKARRFFRGCKAKPWILTKEARDYTAIQREAADVFVGCYQQLGDRDPFFADLLKYKDLRWLIFLDEYHHLYLDGQWARRQESLKAVVRLYTSATPRRNDGVALHGAPTSPVVSIGFGDAYRERAVRLPICHNDHYQVHCEDQAGNEHHFKTSDLLAEKVENFEEYEIKRQLRYKRDYLDWMLLDPIQKLQQKQLAHPASGGGKQHQMIVFAMSCKHADFLCFTIRGIVAQINGGSITCDWVGVGEGNDGRVKSDPENKHILDSFKDGKLDILVQVNKCGEGFSVDTASVLVFLNLIKSEPQLMQQLGRGLRRNHLIDFEDDVCDVFVSADSPIADLVSRMEAEVAKNGGGGNGGDDRQPQLYFIPDIVVVRSEREHRDVVTPDGASIILRGLDLELADRYHIPADELLRYKARVGLGATAPAVESHRNSQDRLASIKSQVDRATSLYVGSLLSLFKFKSGTIAKDTAGKFKRSVNGRWNVMSGMKHEAMLETDFLAKHKWLQEEAKKLRESKELPPWL